MAQLNYEDFIKMTASQNTNQGYNRNKPYVGYLRLAEDGDTALVRFNIKDIDDVKVFSRHQVIAGGKRRNISCLRTSYNDPVDVCPLCASGNKPSFRTLIQVLNYETTDKGVQCIASVWEQPAKIRETLKSFTVDYGDLRDYLFKIVRHGKRGDTSTIYTIIPANMNMYKPEVYQPKFELFDSVKYNSFIIEKTAKDMEYFLENGNFPNPYEKKNKTQDTVNAQPPVKPYVEPRNVQELPPQVQPTSVTPVVKKPVEESSTPSTGYSPRRYTY